MERHDSSGAVRFRQLLKVLLVYSILFAVAAIVTDWYRTVLSTSGNDIENQAHEMKELPESMKQVVRNYSRTKTFHFPVILYHYVEYVMDKRDTIRKSLDTTPDIFDHQVRTLQNAGYVFLTASDLADILDAKRDVPVKAVFITFDDGYRDFYTDVFPVLKKYRIRSTAYLVPGFLDKPNYMYRSEVRDLVKSGLVEIGAHTIHHVNLKGKPLYEISQEVVGSKRMLEAEFQIPVVSFAYPYGAFDERVVDVVKEAGFRSGATTIAGTAVNQQGRFFFPRIRAGNRTGDELLSYIAHELIR